MSRSSKSRSNQNPLYGVAVGVGFLLTGLLTFFVPIVAETWISAPTRHFLGVLLAVPGVAAAAVSLFDWVRMDETPRTWG